ncbi:MAG: hypothetical protein EOM17_14030 [Synergistales bacterium]|nr:hypothetical protein [Synergistales bacterium]
MPKNAMLTVETPKDSDVAKSSFGSKDESRSPRQSIQLDYAEVRIDQRNNSTASSRPCLEFELIFSVSDDKSGAILEWANCFWSKGKFASRIIRKVTLEFDYEGTHKDVDSRKFVIERAFIAFFEETFSDDTQRDDHKNKPQVRLIIRANDEEQTVTLSQDLPKKAENGAGAAPGAGAGSAAGKTPR